MSKTQKIVQMKKKCILLCYGYITVSLPDIPIPDASIRHIFRLQTDASRCHY